MPKWSEKQDEYLLEHCNEGPERIADAMRRRFGVSRSPEAVRRHAYRIGAPLVVYEVCPQCGGRRERLLRTGVCYQCNQHNRAEEQRRRNDQLRREIRESASPEAKRKADREYDAARAEASRLRRKLRVSSPE